MPVRTMKFCLGLVFGAATVLSATTKSASSPVEHGGVSPHKHRHRHGHGRPPTNRCTLTPSMGNATFAQLIDHDKPEFGTFEQFYYWSTTHWADPGSPIILFSPGEENATAYTGYLTNSTTPGVLAQEAGGANIILEHRYWGFSSPFPELTTENLQHLTLENNIRDLTNFAQNVRLPFAKHGSNAADVPWVISSASYPGALSAWLESVSPGVYWAYHASSAPVQAIRDFWSYFTPIEEGMPKNCSKDGSVVVGYLDHVLTAGSASEIQAVKTPFGLQDIQHSDDFMAAILSPLWLWQTIQFDSGYSPFYVFCDSVEGVYQNSSAVVPGMGGVGLSKALTGYAKWFKEIYLPGACESLSNNYPEYNGTLNTYCFVTHDPKSPMFTNTSLSNTVDRAWVWMTCNQPFAYWQNGAGTPSNRPSIASRLVTADYWIRQCGLFFPPDAETGATYGIARGVTVEDTNRYTKGWQERPAKRLIYTSGQFDPWREAGVSSSQRPGGALQSTTDVDVNVVPGGFHGSDLLTRNGAVNAGCKTVIDKQVARLAQWIREFPRPRHSYSRAGGPHYGAGE